MIRLNRQSEQTVMSLDESSLLPRSVIASPDGLRIAYVYKNGNLFNRKHSVGVDATLDAAPGKVLGCLAFSPDSQRLAYVSKSRSGFTLVVDGSAGQGYERLFPETLRFSPDSSQVAVLTKSARGYSWLIDGTEGMTHDAAPVELVFSPSGGGMAYIVKSDKRCVIVLNGKPLREHDEALGAVFSPDGSRFAYVAREGTTMFVVLDGQTHKEYEAIHLTSLVFSPDSSRFAYSAAQAGKNLVVLDDNETELYDATLGATAGSIAFSPDSQRVAYGIKDGSRWRALVDGEDFGAVDTIMSSYHMASGPTSGAVFTFSPDSRQVVYLGTIDYGGAIGDRSVIVLNGREQAHEFSSFIYRPVFSPNSDRLAYAGVESGEPLLVLDGAGIRPDHVLIGSALCFSPDSAHLAYMAARGDEQFVVVDQVESGPFGPMRFDEGNIIFDSPADLHYLVMRQWDVVLVRDRIESDLSSAAG